MKRALRKPAYCCVALLFMAILLVPAMFVNEILFPSRPGPDGLYRNGTNQWSGWIAPLICLWIADQITSRLFRMARITDDRWSLFMRRWP